MNNFLRLLLPLVILATIALLGSCRHRPYRGGPYYGGSFYGGPWGGPLYSDPFYGGPYRTGWNRGFYGAPPGYWADVQNPNWRRYPPNQYRPGYRQPRPVANPNRAGSGGGGPYKPGRVVNQVTYAGGGPRGGSRSAFTQNVTPSGRGQVVANRAAPTRAASSAAARGNAGGGGGGGGRGGGRGGRR